MNLPQNPTIPYIPKRNESRDPIRHLHAHDHHSIIQTILKVEATQVYDHKVWLLPNIYMMKPKCPVWLYLEIIGDRSSKEVIKVK